MTIQEQNQFLTQRRWRVLAACCITNLCLGAPYAWSVFAGLWPSISTLCTARP